MIHYLITSISLGRTILARSSAGLCYVGMADSDAELISALKARFAGVGIARGDEAFERELASVMAYLENLHGACPLPLDIQGTELQKAVWQQLRAIPYGQTITYSELAVRVGKPKAVRAVANACGANALTLIIPCHRVLRKSGDLGGYAWGIERKSALLARERALACAA